MIVKTHGGYVVMSKDGKKRLSKPASYEEALKRLRQIEYFKHAKAKYSVPTKADQYADRNIKSLEKEMRQHHVPLKTRLQWHSRIFGGSGGRASEDLYRVSQGKKKDHVYIYPYVKNAPPEVNRILEETYRKHRAQDRPAIAAGLKTEAQSKVSAAIAAWNNVRKAGYKKVKKLEHSWVKKYASHPVHHSVHMLKPKPSLPKDWVGNYVNTIRNLSGKHVEHRDTPELESFLTRLVNHAKALGHIHVFKPVPANGVYPEMSHVSVNALKKAVSDKTPLLKREHFWNKFRAPIAMTTRGRLRSFSGRWTKNYLGLLREHNKIRRFGEIYPGQIHHTQIKFNDLVTSARNNGRGTPWYPSPNEVVDLTNFPGDHVRTAVRANTSPKKREKIWRQIARRAYLPIHGIGESVRNAIINDLDNHQRKRFMEAAAVALPIAKGREPAFLGQRVPGEMNMGPAGTSTIIGQNQMNPGDYLSSSPMKFSIGTSFPKAAKFVTKEAKALRKLINVAKENKLVLMGAGGIATVAADPMTSTPGFYLGFRRGASGKSLTGRQRLVDRFIPGYLDAYDTGKDSRPKYGKNKATRAWRGYSHPRTHAYASSSELTQAYSLGIQYGLADFFRNVKNKFRDEFVPVVIRGAYVGGLGRIHQDVGLPPTTVDGIPLTRRAVNKAFAPFTTTNLAQAQQRLLNEQKHAVRNNDTDRVKAIQKALENVNQEIVLRGALPGG